MPATAAQRLTVNLSGEAAEFLEELAEERGISKTEVLRRALATEKFVWDTIREGRRLLVQDPQDNSTHELVFR